MIKEFVDLYMKNKHKLEETFRESHADDYDDLVKRVITILDTGDVCESVSPDHIFPIPSNLHEGALVYVIATRYQVREKYWYVKIAYGSCCACDALERVRTGLYDDDYIDDHPSERQVKDYMTLCLHIVQGLKEMGEDSVFYPEYTGI